MTIVRGPLRLLELTLTTAAENVALDEALLRMVEAEGSEPILRLWELDTYAVVLGRSNRVERNVDVEACRRDGVPIIRRLSGGGSVLLGPGALVFSLVLPIDTSDHLAQIATTTREILNRVSEVLAERVTSIEHKGTSDLAVGDLKISGNAQRWLRRTMLHHGTLLYNFDLAKMERYLTPPEREPEYRAGRAHQAFVTNLPLERAELRELLIQGWQAHLPPPPTPLELVEQILGERYTDREWLLDRHSF